ncbi:MAG: glycosyltransferase family 4 protein [Candidatus Omnitrophica bacterium]|nr:glycosyltransferase family 4 protein [Candidatus Omnitrophota bacterium]
MRVIFVTREGYRQAGARIRCYNLARQLRLAGFETKVFSFADDLGARDGEQEYGMSLSEKIGYNIRAFRRLAREGGRNIFFIQRLNYHVLAPIMASVMNRNKIIFDCDDWNIRENPRYYWIFPSSKMEYFTRRMAGYADACIAASFYLKKYLRPFSRRIYYLPTGVDTRLFTPVGSNEKGRIVFFWAGTVFHKDMFDNIRFMLSCFSELKKERADIYLKIAGCGSYYEQIRKDALYLNCADRIEFCGWVQPDDMPAALSQVDICLLPLIQNSRFNAAKSPTKLFEYMAMGKPVIASATGEACRILSDGKTGFLASGKDEFAHYMRLLCRDNVLRRELGCRARQAVLLDYSLEVMGGKLAKIINDI